MAASLEKLYERKFGYSVATTIRSSAAPEPSLPVTPAQLEQPGGCAYCHAPVQPGETFCSKRCEKKDGAPQ